MTDRARYLLFAAGVSALLWGGIIWGGASMMGEGIDHHFTASTR